MIGQDALAELGLDGEGDLLTRKEASAYLALLGVAMRPATLARLWSTGRKGPPCRHVRSKPYYPRTLLRDWARLQIGEVHDGAPPAAGPRRHG